MDNELDAALASALSERDALKAEVERVTRERDEAVRQLDDSGARVAMLKEWKSLGLTPAGIDKWNAMVARAESAESRVAELAAALKPFAEAADQLPSNGYGDACAWLSELDCGHFRHARRALAAPPQERKETR